MNRWMLWTPNVSGTENQNKISQAQNILFRFIQVNQPNVIRPGVYIVHVLMCFSYREYMKIYTEYFSFFVAYWIFNKVGLPTGNNELLSHKIS